MFILSINDVEPIRELFKEFQIEKVMTTYSAGGANKTLRVGELLITNYKATAHTP
jgi:purine-nucleoside phosphorylase